MIDTHTHLYLPEFKEDDAGNGAVKRAFDAGIDRLIFPNVDLTTITPMQTLAAAYPNRVFMAMGLHPTEVKETWQEDVEQVMTLLGDGHDYVAVGEVGIDLYWDKTYEREQLLAFDRQVARAESLGLPVIIHCREGQQQVLEVLQEHPQVQAVFHSFGGTVDDVKQIRQVGDYYFGINGIVTFKNCKVREALSEITLERLLLETDAPYLAPVPHRGKRNESAFMIHTAAHIAAHLGIDVNTVERHTDSNAQRLFKLPPQA